MNTSSNNFRQSELDKFDELAQRIEAELGADSGNAQVVALRRSLRRWQWAGGLSFF